LIAPGEGVDDPTRIWVRGLARQRIGARQIIEATGNPANVSGARHARERLVDRIARAKVQEVGWRPDAEWRLGSHTLLDFRLEIRGFRPVGKM
jgi:hypothetical protein